MTFRYDTTGSWFKGNTHIHSPASDGGKAFRELAQMYAAAGYHFLFRTDHNMASNVSADRAAYPLLWLDGIELAGPDRCGSWYHVVCLGTLRDMPKALMPAMEAARAQGALLILAHPYWTGNTLDDALRHGFHGVERYNHVCHWMNGKSEGGVHWDAMLRLNTDTLSFAVDDAHLTAEHPVWNGGWIMVNSLQCSRESIMDAIRRGNFYSSCGPQIDAIEYDGKAVSLRTPGVRLARLVGPADHGRRLAAPGSALLTEATFEVTAEWAYAYVEVEDDAGRRAWTNPLFTRAWSRPI